MGCASSNTVRVCVCASAAATVVNKSKLAHCHNENLPEVELQPATNHLKATHQLRFFCFPHCPSNATHALGNPLEDGMANILSLSVHTTTFFLST